MWLRQRPGGQYALCVTDGQRPSVRFLIVGVARSGTTLTQRLATELNGVWVPPETHFWRHARLLARRFDWPLSDDDVRPALELLTSLPGAESFPLDPDVAAQRVPAEPLLWDLFDAAACAAVPPGNHIVGEKTPAHLRWTTRLLEEVPELCVVGVRRDAVSTFASHARVAWGERDPGRFVIRHQLADSELLMAKHTHPTRVLLLDHSEMTADPDRARGQIAELLGVDATRVSTLDPAGLIGEEPWKEAAFGEIKAQSPSRDGLGDEELAALEKALSGWDISILDDGLAGHKGLVQELTAFAQAHEPLPISAESLDDWLTSDFHRAQSWERRSRAILEEWSERVELWQARAEELNQQLLTEKTRAGSWRTRAEELNQQLSTEKTRAGSWRTRAEELNQQLSTEKTRAGSWRTRAEELNQQLSTEKTRAGSWRTRAEELRAEAKAATQRAREAEAELARRWPTRLRRALRGWRRRD